MGEQDMEKIFNKGMSTQYGCRKDFSEMDFRHGVDAAVFSDLSGIGIGISNCEFVETEPG